MKNRNKYFLMTLCLIIGVSVQAQLKVGSNSNIGIGTDPTSTEKFKLTGNSFFNGNIGIGTTPTTTERLKVNGTSMLNGDILMYPISGMGFKVIKFSTGYFPDIVVNEAALVPIGSSSYLGRSDSRFAAIYTSNLYYGSLYQLSDKNVKKNIKPLDVKKANKLNLIKVYTYDMDEKLYDSINNETIRNISIEEGKDQAGVLAQELMDIYPKLVKQDPDSKLYTVNYVGLVPYLLQAVQDLSKAMDAQTQEMQTLKTELAYYQNNCCSNNGKAPKKSTGMDNGNMGQANLSDVVTAARLDQNMPNPFSQETRIGYFIPKDAKTAALFIYDLQGKQLKHIAINSQGEGSTNILGREFKAGMYLYTLVIDNELVDTKRMILTE